MDRPNIFKRAFELAPRCYSLVELKARLNGEGYIQVDAHFSGRQIKQEIRELLADGRLTPPGYRYEKKQSG